MIEKPELAVVFEQTSAARLPAVKLAACAIIGTEASPAIKEVIKRKFLISFITIGFLLSE